MNRRIPRGEVPGCDTGPGGRLLFVVTELRDVWTARRRRRARGDEIADDSEDDTDPAPSNG